MSNYTIFIVLSEYCIIFQIKYYKSKNLFKTIQIQNKIALDTL